MAISIEHNLFPDLLPRAELFEKAGLLEKSWLDQAEMGLPTHLERILRSFRFFRILGSPAVFHESSSRVIAQEKLSGIISALYNQMLPIVYVIRGEADRIQVFLGTNHQGAASLSALLAGHLNHSLYSPETAVNEWALQDYQHGSTLTGVPHLLSEKSKEDSGIARQHSQSLDLLLLGLLREEWIYVVQAFPIARQQTSRWFEQCAREIKDTKEAFLLRDAQKANRMASYYVEILEKSVQRLRRGKLQGLWQTGVYLLCRNAETAARASALLCSIYAGERSAPEPVRSHVFRSGGSQDPFINCYHPGELEAFVSLPRREFQGFCLQEEAPFDVDFISNGQRPVVMGRILDHRTALNNQCSVPVDDLTMHALVAGVTGSGKTTTIFHLLKEIHGRYNIPFLVIEPAKSEYRSLLREIDSLLIFTLGEERPGLSAPFRFNPFSFPSGIGLQTHIDYLKAVFNASFVMYAPMPYVLDECLYRIYEDRGWSLISSSNLRGTNGIAFPTLSDLYLKIDQVVDGLGYQDRTTMDIKAALKTRIRNLCLGGKGMMLNTTSSLPFQDLMGRPVVLELKHLGNDEEKAFMMGLILMALSEHWEAISGSETSSHEGLRHLTVIEEAHRLLRNVPLDKASEEQSNIRGKGVETFCNLLAEIRAYGEGVLVSEQIPTKLAPDVIKNSNLKIMHRMVSREDRDVMGDTMNLDSLQKRQLVSMETGEAVFFREGLDRPLRIRVPRPETGQDRALIEGTDLRTAMVERFYQHRPHMLQEKPACNSCSASGSIACERIRGEVRSVCEREDIEETLVRCFFPFLLQPNRGDARAHILSVLGLPEDYASAHFRCMASNLIRLYLRARGEFEQWPFETIEGVAADAEMAIESGAFAQIISMHCLRSVRARGASLACDGCCKVKCLFGYEGRIIVRDPVLHNNIVRLLDAPEYGLRFHQDLAILIADHLRGIFAQGQERYLSGPIICCLVNKLVEIKTSIRTQQIIMERFAQVAESIQ